jgi:hypothetical protein
MNKSEIVFGWYQTAYYPHTQKLVRSQGPYWTHDLNTLGLKKRQFTITLEDALKIQDVYSNIKKRLPKARVGTVLRVCQLGRNDSMYLIRLSSEQLSLLRAEQETKKVIKEIRHEIYEQTKELHRELSDHEKVLKYLRKQMEKLNL